MSPDSYEIQLKSDMLMLVEDNAANIMIATLVLSELGYDFHIANNGAEAVALFEKGSYSLILMDLQMPVMSGIEATKCIRSHELNRNQLPTRIIALTANDSFEDRKQCADSGMDDYVMKPYLPEELGLKIADHLAKRHMLQQSQMFQMNRCNASACLI